MVALPAESGFPHGGPTTAPCLRKPPLAPGARCPCSGSSLPSKHPRPSPVRCAETSIAFHATPDAGRQNPGSPRAHHAGEAHCSGGKKHTSCRVVFSACCPPATYSPCLPIFPLGHFGQDRQGGPISDSDFSAFSHNLPGPKEGRTVSSHGSVFYPSQNGVRSSPFSGPIKARWCGRTRFIQENGEKHVDLILLEYSLHHSCYSHDPRATKLIGYVFKCLIKGPGI